MPEYMWEIALIFWVVYVFSHVRATMIVQKMCEKTCSMLDMQTKVIKEELEKTRY